MPSASLFHRRSSLSRLLPAFILFASVAACAQGRSIIYGTSTDASGAVIPGVHVVVTETATQQKHLTDTNAQGEYSVPALAPGEYSVTATANGFETFLAPSFRLQVDENRDVVIKLLVGSASDQVVVTTESALVDTHSSTITEVIDSERVKQLPLNGRNPLQLQSLVAGAGLSSAGGGGQAENNVVALNGNRPNQNNYTLDSADNEDPFFNAPSVVPNPDALDQFSLQTSNYDAQQGRGSGAQMNAVTKSGTNQIHGVVFEYLRNDAMDAKGYFATAAKAPLHRNQFGGAVGGPILRNRIFYFGAYQGTRQSSSPNAISLIVPSAAERTGNFAELLPKTQLTLPGTTTPAPGNDLTAYANPAALKFLTAFVPLPNGAGNEYTYNPASTLYEDQYIGKIDSVVGRHDTLSGRFVYVANKVLQEPSTSNLPGFLAQINYSNYNVAINETHTVSPSLLNLFTFGFNDIARHQLPVIPQQLSWADFGSGITRAINGAPIGWDTTVSGDFGSLSRWPLDQLRAGYQFSDVVNWTRGKHQLAMGGDLRLQRTDQSQTYQSDASLTFSGTFTRNSLADLLVGRMSKITQQSENGGKPAATTPDLFVQDDWRVTQRLTLNLGVRWEPFIPLHDRLDRVSQNRPGEQSVVLPNAPVGYVFPGDPGVPTNTYPAKWDVFAPRVGFAWDVYGTGKTSVRGSIGVYDGSVRSQALNNVSTNLPYAYSLSVSSPSGGLTDPYSDVGGNPFPFTPPAASQFSTYKFGTPLAALTDFAPDFRNSRVEQWNANVQQKIAGGGVITIAYVGSTGEHLFATVEEDPAVATNPGATTQARRVNPAFTTIAHQFSGSHSTYNSLQTTYNKRLSHGVSVLANYTWAHSIDNASDDSSTFYNPFNLRSARGLSDFDIRNSFVTSFVWQVPHPAGGRLLERSVASGWELNGIVSLATGSPFSVLSGVDNSKSGVNQDLADRTAPAHLNSGASRTQEAAQWFTTTSYATNAIGTFGNSGRNSLVGPGVENFDFGFNKQLPSPERVHLIFRAEAFNLLNHTNLGTPNATFSSLSFGRITSLNANLSPRVLQVALRAEF